MFEKFRDSLGAKSRLLISSIRLYFQNLLDWKFSAEWFCFQTSYTIFKIQFHSFESTDRKISMLKSNVRTLFGMRGGGGSMWQNMLSPSEKRYSRENLDKETTVESEENWSW